MYTSQSMFVKLSFSAGSFAEHKKNLFDIFEAKHIGELNNSKNISKRAKKSPLLSPFGPIMYHEVFGLHAVAQDVKPACILVPRNGWISQDLKDALIKANGELIKFNHGGFGKFYLSTETSNLIVSKDPANAFYLAYYLSELKEAVFEHREVYEEFCHRKIGKLLGYPEQSIEYFASIKRYDAPGSLYYRQLVDFDIILEPYSFSASYIPGIKEGSLIGTDFLKEVYLAAMVKEDSELMNFSLLQAKALSLSILEYEVIKRNQQKIQS